ncbi:helix-turn-helix transcriptional regulator [Ochrobactrum sp. Marseille-Q0166]|uniref:ArsR/SmtB family transcription factor n=1 Tax=Ochrobactrum sp. Marseille-Q0166 TaxID=2761105 RepID=UPI00165640FA|nr:helix-turn-helix transcriptional regulator [Ochrobactrum sp. Marseille-Q0166]MBC8716931.1 helix-turn-helix transcriptional regulator [Ochrobactrum sp. Marseille-Q0166]
MSDIQSVAQSASLAMPLDEILKVLGHPVRLDILSWLKQPEKHFSAQHMPLEMGVCAGQFERCGLSQSTVSAHLSVLTKAGLITPHRVGQWTFYKRDEAAIAALLKSLSDL